MRLRAVAAALLFAAPLAAAPRTFVAPSGVDTNPCSLAAPCRTFQAAVNVTDIGGEVVALGSAGYGPVTINQSMSITAPTGVYAGITQSAASPAVEITAAALQVILRGLTLNGVGSATTGIDHNGYVLRVESCVISNFPSEAIRVSTASSKAFVVDSLARDSGYGVYVAFGSAVLDHDRFEHEASDGVAAFNGTVTAHDVIAAHNGSSGFNANNNSGGSVMTLDSCVAAYNAYGVSENVSTVTLSNCTITLNSFGITATGGLIYSRQNNTVNSNTTMDVNATITPLTAV